jgi:thiosulfate dehydrogenase [quinone] large subunit
MIDGNTERLSAKQLGKERGLDLKLAYLFLRLTLGVNICFHGVSRLLAGPAVFASSLLPEFQKTLLPSWSVYGFGLTLPWTEAILGFLLLIGLGTRWALIGGSLLILVLTFGSTLHQDWNAAGAQLVYAAIYAALLAFRERNAWSVDSVIESRQG